GRADAVTYPGYLSEEWGLFRVDGNGVLDGPGSDIRRLILLVEALQHHASAGDRPASTRLETAFSISCAPIRAAFGDRAARIRIRSHRIGLPMKVLRINRAWLRSVSRQSLAST